MVSINSAVVVTVVLVVGVAIAVGGSNENEQQPSGTCGDGCSWSLSLDTGKLEITGDGTMTDFNDINVAPWFEYRNSITNVSIGSGIQNIGSSAFIFCTSLIGIDRIPESVHTIGSNAFHCCSKLTSILFPNTLTTIYSWAFVSCMGLTTITIPASVTRIYDSAFQNCRSLSSVSYLGTSDPGENNQDIFTETPMSSLKLPGGYSGQSFCGLSVPYENPNPAQTHYFGESGDNLYWSFDNTAGVLTISGVGNMNSFRHYNPPWFGFKNAIKSVLIEENVTSIGKFAFACCTELKEISIPNTVTSIGNHAFEFSGLTQITIPDSVTEPIGLSTFDGCYSLVSVKIGKNIPAIGNCAFQLCQSLTSLIIPGSVTSIGSFSIRGCVKLTSVYIPYSVTSIGSFAMAYNPELSDVCYHGKNDPANGTHIFERSDKLARVYVSLAYTLHSFCGKVIEKKDMCHGPQYLTVIEPKENDMLVSGEFFVLSYEAAISLGSSDYIQVSLVGSETAFTKMIYETSSFYRENISIVDGPLCGTYTLKASLCRFGKCSVMDEVKNVHFNYIEKLIITAPTNHDDFRSDDDITVQWDYQPNGGVSQNILIQLYSLDDGGVPTMEPCQERVSMAEKSRAFDYSCFTPGHKYKFTFLYNSDGTSFSNTIETDIISYGLPSDSHSLNVYQPEIGAFYHSGDTLTVKWEALGWNGDEKVNIYLYRDQLGPDSLLFTKADVLVASETDSFTIPEETVVGSSTDYYIYIGYDCGTFWCAEGFYSKNFAINCDAPFIITNELDDDTIYFPGVDREVTWTTTITTPDVIYVSLKAEYPSIIKLPDKTLTYEKTTATALSVILHPKEGSALPVYYQISYDCWFLGYFCKEVYSKNFNLIDVSSVKWNEKEDGSVKEKHINMDHATCESEHCTNSSDSIFCKACNAGLNMTTTATCENCHAKLYAGFYGLDLEFTGLSINSFQLGFYGRTELDIHLNVESYAAKNGSFSKGVFSYTPPRVSFFIGPVPIEIGCLLTGTIFGGYSVNGSMQGSADAKGTLNVFAKAQYGERVPVDEKGVSVFADMDDDFSPKYSFYTHTEAGVRIGFKLGVSSDVSKILILNTSAQVSALIHTEVDTFPALPGEHLYENTTWNYGSCSNPHYLEYHLGLTGGCQASTKFAFAPEHPLLQKYYNWPTLIILSGCLIPTKTAEETEKMFSKFFDVVELPSDELPFSDDVVNTGLAMELSDRMSWPKGSVIAALQKSSKTRDGTEKITGVNVTLLPVTASDKQKYSTRTQLEGRLAKELNNLDSSFYSGVIGRYFKGKFVEQTEESYSYSESNVKQSLSSSSVLSVSYLVSIAFITMAIFF